MDNPKKIRATSRDKMFCDAGRGDVEGGSEKKQEEEAAIAAAMSFVISFRAIATP